MYIQKAQPAGFLPQGYEKEGFDALKYLVDSKKRVVEYINKKGFFETDILDNNEFYEIIKEINLLRLLT